MHAPRKLTLAQRLLRSRYFLFAVLIHMLLFIMLATVVIIPVQKMEELPQGTLLPPELPQDKAPDPIRDKPEDTAPPTLPTNDGIKTASDPIVMTRPDGHSMHIPQPGIKPDVTFSPKGDPKTPDSTSKMIERRMPEISKTVGQWRTRAGGPYKIKIYLARYAQGDWNTGLTLKDGKVVGGPLLNLAQSLQRLTRGRVQAEVVPIPLNLASAEILETRPPFIFFTGHKEFTLTDSEVENLRKYLILGGAIWTDNGLAGRGSRFDVSFRREMKKVLSNEDQDFQPLPDSHPLLTKGYFPVREVPAGMNFSREPMEAILMDGQIAVLYTLNDYTDMLRMVFGSDMTTPDLTPTPSQEFVTPADLWHYRQVYYRNFTPENCAQSYRFSANIVFYLLTRFDDLMFGAEGVR